jgi:hypothetical protein
MRALVAAILLAASPARAAVAQAVTYDLATFTPPAGWGRVDRDGILMFQRSQTRGRQTSYGQIFIFPSHPGPADAAANFGAEWARLVAQPFATTVRPRIETKQTPAGWTAVSGAVNVVQRGRPVTAMLFTATGHGRVMSVVVNVSGQDFVPAVQAFFAGLSFQAGDTAPPPVASTPAPAGGSTDDYVYAPPRDWIRTAYPDGIVYASPLFGNGERCQLSVFPMRHASGDLPADARRAFADIFKMDPFQDNAYPYPTATLQRGVAAQGWEYFVIKRSIRGRVGEYGSLLGVTLLAAQLGPQIAIVIGTGKDPLVSNCFGELVHDDWPAFFHSLQFRNWTPVPQETRVGQRLAGTWTTATASVGGQYRFAHNGRYADAAAAQTSTRISPDEVLTTTNAYFGNGAYTVTGNTLTFVADGDRGHPAAWLFRLEQESTDGGTTWKDRLCLYQTAIGEVCYYRE